MKLIRNISLVMAILLCLGMLAGCGEKMQGEALEVKCKILTDTGESLYDDTVSVYSEEPTVYDVISAVMDSSDDVTITLSENNQITKINNYEEKDGENNSSYFWNIVLNDNDASMNDKVRKGSTVVCQYTLFQPEIKLVIKNDKNEEIFNNTVTITEFDDENNQISVINVLKQAEEQFDDLDIGFYKKDGKETSLKSVNDLIAGEDETTGLTGKWSFAVKGTEITEKLAYEFMVTSGDDICYTFTQTKS